MQVDDLMTQQIQTCRPGDSLEQAAQLMWDNDCGVLPVCTNEGTDQLVGVITDRDICMCALFQHKPLSELHVSQAMAQNVLTCRPQDSIAQAEQAMQKARVRRLPVLDAEGSLVGMLSLADIAREAVREQKTASPEITDAEVNLTIAAICHPSVARMYA